MRLFAAFLFAAGLFAESPFFLKDGDTVVFYGDSITDQRLYTTFAETYVVTRFPKLNVKFIHSGWGGDRVTGGGGGPIDVRLSRDVYAYKPTVMTIMLGMNDGSYRAFDETVFSTFSGGYRGILSSLRQTLPNLRLTLIQPSPYDDVTRAPGFPGGYNAVLVRYGQFVAGLAKDKNQLVADLNTPMVAMLQAANADSPTDALKIIPDRVHPGPAGHLIMAEALLKSWNAPALISSVEIDGSIGAIVSAENTAVTDMQSVGGLSWSQMDNALPMPVNADAVTALAVRSSDFTQALNQETLKVTGLTEPQYVLMIDGATAGTFTPRQLTDGVNLATLPTPMNRQAAEVHALTLQHNNLHFTRWRQVQVPLAAAAPENYDRAMQALDALEADVITLQRAAAQPKPHTYQLLPQ